MNQTTKEAYDAAVATLTDADMTAAGLPKMDPLNAALAAAWFEAIKSADRNAFAAKDALGGETNTEAPDPTKVKITINDAPANPLPLYIHGIGGFELRIGETNTLPREALDALHSAGGIDYTVEEITK